MHSAWQSKHGLVAFISIQRTLAEKLILVCSHLYGLLEIVNHVEALSSSLSWNISVGATLYTFFINGQHPLADPGRGEGQIGQPQPSVAYLCLPIFFKSHVLTILGSVAPPLPQPSGWIRPCQHLCFGTLENNSLRSLWRYFIKGSLPRSPEHILRYKVVGISATSPRAVPPSERPWVTQCQPVIYHLVLLYCPFGGKVSQVPFSAKCPPVPMPFWAECPPVPNP